MKINPIFNSVYISWKDWLDLWDINGPATDWDSQPKGKTLAKKLLTKDVGQFGKVASRQFSIGKPEIVFSLDIQSVLKTLQAEDLGIQQKNFKN